LRGRAAVGRTRREGPWHRGAKKGRLGQELAAALAAEAAAEVTRLAAAAAASVAAGAGLEAAENAIRAGLVRLGAGVLEDLLAADPGHAGPRAACGHRHQARLVAGRLRTCCTRRSMAPACPWCRPRPRAGPARARTGGRAPAR